jgi:hypothetical protein
MTYRPAISRYSASASIYQSLSFKTYITKFLAVELVSFILPLGKYDTAFYPIKILRHKRPYLKASEEAKISCLSVLP